MTPLSEVFSACLKGSVAVLGIGNRLRGDDAAGSLLAERLRRRVGSCVLDCGEVPENYTAQVKQQRPRTVILLDAIRLGWEPGAVAAFRGRELNGPARPTTHNPSLAVLTQYLARETGAQVFLLGIQPRHTGFGQDMSQEVSRTLDILEDLLASCLADQRRKTLATGE